MKLEQLLYIEGPRKHWALHNQQMTRINLHLSTITPNINGFGSSVKRHRLEDLTRKQEYSFSASKKHT